MARAVIGLAVDVDSALVVDHGGHTCLEKWSGERVRFHGAGGPEGGEEGEDQGRHPDGAEEGALCA
jgi:hypothetical protein